MPPELASRLSADAKQALPQQQAPAGLTATSHVQHAALATTQLQQVLQVAQRAQLGPTSAPFVQLPAPAAQATHTARQV
jgi:hypothetical protein